MAQGVYSQHRMSFPRVAITDNERQRELRTDSNFRSRFQPTHHNVQERTILEELPIDMIKSFPVSDSLHLFDLGIVKRWGAIL